MSAFKILMFTLCGLIFSLICNFGQLRASLKLSLMFLDVQPVIVTSFSWFHVNGYIMTLIFIRTEDFVIKQQCVVKITNINLVC